MSGALGSANLNLLGSTALARTAGLGGAGLLPGAGTDGRTTLALQAGARSSTLSLDGQGGRLALWSDDPVSAPRIGLYQAGSAGQALTTRTLATLATFTRNSTATDIDATGALVPFAVNALRGGYLPGTLAPAGWLIEGPTTNLVSNPRGEGATVSTFPTGWYSFTPLTGLTETITPGVTEAGVPGIYLRLQGTPSAAGTYLVSGGNVSGSFANNATALAASLKVVAGSTAGITSTTTRSDDYSSGGTVFVGSPAVTNGALPTTGAPARYPLLYTAGAGVDQHRPIVALQLDGTAVDITLFIGGWQLEQNFYASSLALPPAGTPGAQPRAVDVLTVTGAAFSSAFGSAASGFVIADVQMDVAVSSVRTILTLDDGSGSNRLEMRPNSTGATALVVTYIGGSQTTTPGFSAPAYGAVSRWGMRWGGGAVGLSVNGSAVQSYSPGVVPGLSAMRIGASLGGGTPMNGRVRGLWGGPYLPTDAQLASATTLGADVEAVMRT